MAARWIQKNAGPLSDASKLRHQAVFLMGAGGSGKGHVAYRWLKYMPGAGSGGIQREDYKRMTENGGVLPEEQHTPEERSLANISFLRAVEALKHKGFHIEIVDPEHARIPFEIYNYDQDGRERMIHREDWEHLLPKDVLAQVESIQDVVFSAPKYELPAYWRQVNPDVFKSELPGYHPKTPGYVHEMSSEMAKAYFIAALETGDPIFIDQTGANRAKLAQQIQEAQSYGYRVSLVLVYVPLTVNQIRNATRERNVNPDEVTRQWKQITSNFAALRNTADKAYAVDNRNDTQDRRRWETYSEQINTFIAKRTNYENLCDLVTANAPNELDTYSWICRGGRILEMQQKKR